MGWLDTYIGMLLESGWVPHLYSATNQVSVKVHVVVSENQLEKLMQQLKWR